MQEQITLSAVLTVAQWIFMCCWLCGCIKRRRCVVEYQSLHFHLSLVCSLSEDNILISLIAVRLFGAHPVHKPHLLFYQATSAAVCHLKTETPSHLLQNNYHTSHYFLKDRVDDVRPLTRDFYLKGLYVFFPVKIMFLIFV